MPHSPSNPASAEFAIQRARENALQADNDQLAVEEPLEIRVASGPRENRATKPVAITMRTPTRGDSQKPGAVPHDFELAVGFLFSEGILHSPADVERVLFCGPETAPHKIQNVVRVELSPAARFDAARLERHFFTNSSCGICGKTTLDALQTLCPAPLSDDFQVSPSLLHALPEFLREAQSVFDRTGGLHATALFDLNGKMLALREDVGRHNALDKLVGSHFFDRVQAGNNACGTAALGCDSTENNQAPRPESARVVNLLEITAGRTDTAEGGCATFSPAAESPFPLSRRLLLLSGRASFELLQKSAMAGIALVAAVGAPSSLAVDLARQFNITLVGFLRNNRFNIYSGEQRIAARTPIR